MTAKIQDWPLDKFIEYELNPRVHTPEMIATAARAIGTFGFRVPMLARTSGEIIDGHLRLKAARALGLDSVPVMLADDMTPEMVKAFRLSVNRIADLADWDETLLASELAALESSAFDLSSLGFDEDEFNNLLAENATVVIPPPPRSVTDTQNEIRRIRNLRNKGTDNVISKSDTEHYIVIVFDTREQRESLLNKLGLPTDERYIHHRGVSIKRKVGLRNVDVESDRNTKVAAANKSGATG